MHKAFTDRVGVLQAERGMSSADARAEVLRRFGELRSAKGEPYGVQKVVKMINDGSMWATD